MNEWNFHESSQEVLQALERLPEAEAASRQSACLKLLAALAPEAEGLLVFSRINIYYLTGTLGNGVLWLPRQGEPVLLLRKGLERARAESPLKHMTSFRSYGDMEGLCREAGSPLGRVLGAEMGGLPWSLANLLQSRLDGRVFIPADAVLSKARSRKSPWEMAKLREAGARHERAIRDLLPQRLEPGMTENQIARICIDIYLSLGHGGIMRMNAPGEEVFFGHVAAADSGNYPHYYNGPMGFRGRHPASPCLGSDVVWSQGTPLTVDMAFCYEGYITDKTQTYFAGERFPALVERAWEMCQAVEEKAAASLRPGAIPSRIWSECLEQVDKGGLMPGFMGLGGNKVPFLGHGIGLAIDEQPVIARGFDEALEEGMVIALEPKIGIPGFGMVGVENTFEVSPEGGLCLTGKSDALFIF